jgi:hypothetical protein
MSFLSTAIFPQDASKLASSKQVMIAFSGGIVRAQFDYISGFDSEIGFVDPISGLSPERLLLGARKTSDRCWCMSSSLVSCSRGWKNAKEEGAASYSVSLRVRMTSVDPVLG